MESLNDKRNWNYIDPRANIALDEIELLSERAFSLLARSSSPLLHDHFLQISGAISIMSGIDYHHDRFQQAVSNICPYPNDSSKYHSAMRHEAVAWVNRVGQFHAFSRSELVSQKIGSPTIPTVDSVMPFRHKHTAHRSIDQPRKDDTPYLKVIHAMSLSDLGGTFWKPRLDFSAEDSPTIPVSGRTHFAGFQIQFADGQCKNLFIELDHLNVMNECYSILEKLLK